MTVEIRPYGDKCNLRCKYCYENPLRDYNLPTTPPDWDKIKAELEKQDRHFTVFGGDPLVIPIEELEDIWKFGMEKWGQNGIQTNGTAITSKHIALFKKYHVSVGFSIDGPHTLNDARCAPSGDLNATRALTDTSIQNLKRCLAEGISTSIITTLHKLNVEKIDELVAWFSELEEAGLTHARLHFMENDAADDLVPKEVDLMEALMLLYEFQERKKLSFDIFRELEGRLRTGTGGTCIYNECDPFNTGAVYGLATNGEPTNCGRSNREGIDFLKTKGTERTRALVLENTPFEDGGCEGCRYWYACKGNCPGSGIDGDWRNRTEHCRVLKGLMEYMIERKGIKLLKGCRGGNRDHADKYADSYIDTPHGNTAHIDSDHQNTPHTDRQYLPTLEVRR
jgi:uncharacterized protein